MAPISIKIILDDGAVTRKVKLETKNTVAQAHEIVKDKIVVPDNGKEYGLFLRSTDDDMTGIWLEKDHTLDYYMLRDGDSLDYICKLRNLRVKMLDQTVKTLQVDQSKTVGDLMRGICARIGITNYEEYGLCQDEEEDQEESKEAKNTAATGTLTLKRKAQEKERDAELEELSKKLKTDDNVEWLDHHKTLRETGVDVNETLLLKRRLYYSDRNVDSRDPVQLNLLYLQTRDAILNGKHPVTEEQAAEFAGIQCQIHFDDFQEDKHKPGFIENLSEYLPEQYAKSWGLEKKILKAHKKHIGISQLDAKSLYIKTARDLPTYGVTFFLVKEKQKGKKKLVPRLLGINSESILRLDEVTKEILQVWPLTHVKTYQAGKSETFTLNFGDYSEKEYSVKTRDAHRIRDILEGYIDIIRKRMLAKDTNTGNEGIIIYQDNVEASRGNVIQMVSNNPQKLMSECFIEAQHVMPKNPERVIEGGAQVMNVHQIVVADQVNKQQQAVKGEVPMRTDMPMDCVRRLNRLNTMSVSIVTLLTDPNEQNIREVQRTVDTINREIMPVINDGITKTAERQSTDEAKQKLLNDLKDLSEYVKSLTDSTATGNVKAHDAENAAKSIADLTTQMYFSMDPRTKRRSDLLNRSRKSFIEDERIDSSLRRASFIAAASTALHVLDDVDRDIYQTYKGPALSKDEVEERERAAADKIGKLNAAVALYLTAHSDPKAIDYAAAVTSMNTIKELVPELVKDVQALGSAKDGSARQQLLDGTRALCDSMKKVCTVTGSEDHEKMHEASSKYADASRRLVFTLGCGANPEKGHEIIDLAKAVGDQTSALVMTADEFRNYADQQTSNDIEKAEAHALNCAKDLLACAQVTAGRSGQAVCVGALAGAAEAVSGAGQRVLAACRPLLHWPQQQERAHELRSRATALAEALDALTNACGRLPDDGEAGENVASPQEIRRLKFIKTTSGAKKLLQAANDELDKPDICALMREEDGVKMQDQLSQKLAQLNAAIASLLTATADREKPDYVTAELAVNTITELLPDLVKDAKTLSSSKDPVDRKALLDHIRSLTDASQAICASAGVDDQGLNDSIANYTDSSGKLAFVFKPNRKVDSDKEQEILDLSAGACGTASQLLASVQQLALHSDAGTRQELDSKGSRVADAAQALLTAAQVTGPSISEPRCQSALLSSVDGLSLSSQQLSNGWRQLPDGPQKQALEAELQQIEDALNKIRKACQDMPPGDKEPIVDQKTSPQDSQRLKFINTVSGAKKRFDSVENELNKPNICSLMREEDGAKLQDQLSQKLAQLNAAIASLLRATSDRTNPDYATAEEAITTISTLLPHLVKDAKMLGGTKGTAECQSLMDQLHAFCDASKAICADADTKNEGLSDSIAKFADASGKLVYVFRPAQKVHVDKEQEIMDLSAGACGKASQLLANVQQVAVQLDGDTGQDLDSRGAKVADAAQGLLTTAQITAPSISEPHCQSALLASVDAVSSSSHHLADGWRQLPSNHQRRVLEDDQEQLEDTLNKIRKACQNVSTSDKDLNSGQKPSLQESQRLKFINSVSGANKCLDAVDDDLNKPEICALMREEDGAKLHEKLSHKLALLNAAVASLLTATSDRLKPDYVAAEKAVADITELLPDIIKDAKVLSSTKEPAECKAFLDNIRAMSEATKAICASAVNNPESINESAAKYANASGKLVYVFRPPQKVDIDKEKQIMVLSAGACGKASQLLANVQQVSTKLDGDMGQDLDSKGAKVADATQALLTTAQITAPSISEPHCQSALLASVDAVSSSSHHLADGWRQLPSNHQRRVLEDDQEQLEDMLDKIRKACRDVSTGDKNLIGDQKPSLQESQRLKFINTVSGAKKQLDAIDSDLDKPEICALMREEDSAKLHEKLSHKLALLNATIASLLTATSDRMKPDYVAAEKAVADVSKLLPDIIKDAMVLSSTMEPTECKAFLDKTRAMSEATKAIFTSAANNTEDMNESAANYANASGKLLYVFRPPQKVDIDKEKEILGLSTAACGKASQLLTIVQEAVVQLDGDMGQQLDATGARVADAAQGLLSTAQITAPTILEPSCKSSLLAAVDDFAKLFCQLPNDHHRYISQSEQRQLDDLLDKIREACQNTPKRKLATLTFEAPSPQETERLKFINTMAQAQKWLEAADEELQKPAPNKPIEKEDGVMLKDQLSHKLAQLNAAIASLLTATSNRSNPDYATAEQAIGVVTLLLPDVIKDAKMFSSTMEPAERKVMLDQIRSLCDASKAICANAGPHSKELNDSAEKYAAASGNLTYVFRPARKVDVEREQQIMDLSAGACSAASQLLASVQQLALHSDADIRQELDTKGGKVADAAQALLTATQVTAPSISDPQCQFAVLSSVDGLWAASQSLPGAWSKLPDNQQRRALETELRRLEDSLNKIRGSLRDIPKDGSSVAKTKPPVAVKPISHPIPNNSKNVDLTQGSLEMMPSEDSHAHTQSPKAQTEYTTISTSKTRPAPPAPPKRIVDKEKRLHQQYIQSIDEAEKVVQQAADDLKHLYKSGNTITLGPALNASEAVNKQDQIEEKLALAGVEVASLITANYAEKMDYPKACKAMTTLPQLVSSIVEDGKSFSKSLHDDERKLFLDDMLRLCDASVKLCDSAKKDKEKLKDAAVVFGDESAKLLYFVSTDADAALQKEIIHRAKEIGDSASRLAVQATDLSAQALRMEGAEAGESRAGWEGVWAAGIDTVNAATNLLYTAKLVSPAIYKSTCQNALTASADELSNYLEKFSNSWKSQRSDPHQAKSFEQLAKETDNLEKLVQELKKEVMSGNVGQQRELDRVVVEDTPLRNMTCKIMDDAKKTSQCMELPASLRNKYTEYAHQLSGALTHADLAAHRSRRDPQDTEKRRDLENAIQNLQTVLLQYRPKREGQEQSNIVDLRDFIQDVSTEADKLLERANEVKPTKGQSKIEDIKEHCYKINEHAFKLMNPDQDDIVETSLDGLLQMDHFAQDCESRAERIKLTNEKLEDEKAKEELQPRVHQLNESCDLLRFATRSALSGAQSASLDETLNDLDDLETRVITSLVPHTEFEAVVTRRQNTESISAKPWARSQLAVAVAGAAATADSQPLPAAFTAYATQLACRAKNASPEDKDRLIKHLNKLVHQLKSLTVTTSKRVAMWQPVNHPEVAVITEEILQELENPETSTKSEPRSKLLNVKDANKLLLPNEGMKVAGDKRQLEEKLEQMGGKLMIMSSNIVQSVGTPESLGRSVVATLDCAKSLAALARSLKDNKNPIKDKKIEESALEMSYATYHLLQTSEYASQDPNNPECRGRLLDALRQLNDSVNKLVRTTCPSRSLRHECGELGRNLQVQQSLLLGSPRPHCALPYSASRDALASQQDIIDKLRNNNKMPRDEFAKNLHYVSSAVANSAEYAAHCAYLISISEQNKEVGKEGLVDRQKIHRAVDSMQDTCMAIMRSGHVEDAREEKPKLHEQLQTLSQALDEASGKAKEENMKQQLIQCGRDVNTSATNLSKTLTEDCTKEQLTSMAIKLVGALDSTSSLVDQSSLVPQAANMTHDTRMRCDEIMNHSRALITNTQALIKDVNSSPEDEDLMTWVMFNNRNHVLEVFDALLKSVQVNGQRAGILDGGAEDLEQDLVATSKSNVHIQVETANKWLQNPICKPDKKLAGEEATKKVISFAKKMCEDMKDGEKEDVQQLILETQQLFDDCVVKRDNAKYSALKDRLRELKKAIERGMVTRVVEDLIEEEAPLEDLEILVDAEKDPAKRNYLLEKKIAELLAQLGRVTRTARFVADAGSGSPTLNHDLIESSEQTELLAPLLVKAAQERINKPNDQATVDKYKSLLAKYAESLSKVRELCDVAVDPMDFVQTAGETMERIREQSSQYNDPHKCARTSYAITKLANRVINVGISSRGGRTDPELQQALSAAQQRLQEVQPPSAFRASRLSHWKDSTDEILRATGELESIMGGESIFKKRPNSDQPIFSVAMDLHASVREWSSRDNEIVAVAKRVAVLMAKLSDYMDTDKQRELIATSKSIVEESHEVAYLARKLAMECTDVRIKTNLLKTCERIPTISAQLKMLTTVKGSSLGHQGMKEDKEAMDMLVGNAQSLMLSVQEVVKAAASASVKIMSQRGPRMKWVRKNYYY